MACRGRLGHHRHFTFTSTEGEKAVTLVTDGVEGAFVNEHQQFACQGPWLQIYFTEELCQDILHSLRPLIIGQMQVSVY